MKELAEGLAGKEPQELECAGNVSEERTQLVQEIGLSTLGEDRSLLTEVAL